MSHEAWRQAMTLTLDCVYQVMTARFVYPLRLPFRATVLALVRSGRPWKHRLGAAAMQARQETLAGLIDRDARYRNNLVGHRVLTRLGDGTVKVPVQGHVSPFTGRQLASVPIRAKWIGGVP